VDNYKYDPTQLPRKVVLAREFKKYYAEWLAKGGNPNKYKQFKDDVDTMLAEVYGILPNFKIPSMMHR
jgi:hypothetical protein